MTFHDFEHDFATLAFHGMEDLSLDSACLPEILDTIKQWKTRKDPTDPGTEHLKADHTRGFFIDYRGNSSAHWPDEKSNMLGESLTREYLFSDGICTITSTEVRLVKIDYSIMAGEYGVEYLLIAPVMTQSGNVAGLNIVCLNKYIKE